MRRGGLRLIGLLIAGLTVLAVAAGPSAAQAIAWEQWQHVPGVADVGVRADGTLVAMANARLFLVSPSTGAVTPYANGPDGFLGGGAGDAEYYFVVSPGLALDDAGCSFNTDEVLILDLTSPPGVVRVDASGRAIRLATLSGVDTLGGITLDTVGTFGHRLLVTGTHNGNQTSVFALDCNGTIATLTTSAPQVEGGIAVAPMAFGRFGGQLIAPDENSGQMWAIDAQGQASLIAVPNLPTGGDTGVESVGFVPPGFSAGGTAYLADRGTPNNPFPGTDSLLRLSSSALGAAGVEEGDLLVSTEGGGTTIGIRCAADACAVTSVAQGTPGGHIEGHVLLVPGQPVP